MISIEDINVLWSLVQRTPMTQRETRAAANILGSLQRLTGARLEAGKYTASAAPVVALPDVGPMRWAKKYKEAVAWVAENDSAGEDDALDPEACGALVTAKLVADLFGVADEKVGADIAKWRRKSLG